MPTLKEQYREKILANLLRLKALVMNATTLDELEEIDNLVHWQQVDKLVTESVHKLKRIK